MALSGSVSVILTCAFGGFILGVGMALSGSVSVILTSAFGGFLLGVGMALSDLVYKCVINKCLWRFSFWSWHGIKWFGKCDFQ